MCSRHQAATRKKQKPSTTVQRLIRSSSCSQKTSLGDHHCWFPYALIPPPPRGYHLPGKGDLAHLYPGGVERGICTQRVGAVTNVVLLESGAGPFPCHAPSRGRVGGVLPWHGTPLPPPLELRLGAGPAFPGVKSQLTLTACYVHYHTVRTIAGSDSSERLF